MHPVVLMGGILVILLSLIGGMLYLQHLQNLACIERGFQVVESSCVYPSGGTHEGTSS